MIFSFLAKGYSSVTSAYRSILVDINGRLLWSGEKVRPVASGTATWAAAGETKTIYAGLGAPCSIARIALLFTSIPTRAITLKAGNQILAYTASLTSCQFVYRPGSVAAGLINGVAITVETGAGAGDATATYEVAIQE